MTEPLVCAICLTKDRPEMLARAVRSFQAQTYQRKSLLIWDTSDTMPFDYGVEGIIHARPKGRGTIGMLRNAAAHFVDDADILIHWDDDDWSHPNRIAEQVALLQASGADAVGYREMLFWRGPIIGAVCGCGCHTDPEHAWAAPHCTRCDGSGIVKRDIGQGGQAWLYTNADPRYCLGTSLCYWRKTWDHKQFKDTSNGEDLEWCKGLNTVGVSSRYFSDPGCNPLNDELPSEPLMIATVHGGNTLKYEFEKWDTNGRRVPEWDARVRSIMEAA